MNFDNTDISARLLHTFVVTYEERSVTKAAARLHIGQSTLSHRLNKLRQMFGDELFVKAGRSIVPTMRADDIVVGAKEAIESIRHMLDPVEFEPHAIDDEFVIGTTDYELSVFLIDALRSILRSSPKIHIRFVWQIDGDPTPLRTGQFDFQISPRPVSDEQDIRERPLFNDRFACFVGSNANNPPATLEDYLARRHVRVIFTNSCPTYVDDALKLLETRRRISIDVPCVSEVRHVLRSTDLIATLPSKLQHSVLTEFCCCPVPFRIEPLTYCLRWHNRTHASSKHSWLRREIIRAATNLECQENIEPQRTISL